MEFKVGQRVKVRGDVMDCTDHLDGLIGTIVIPGKDDCRVEFSRADVGERSPTDWWIWNYNITPVGDADG